MKMATLSLRVKNDLNKNLLSMSYIVEITDNVSNL